MLADLVHRCRSTADVAAVFTHLGYDPDEGPPADGWRALARWRSFRVVGTMAPDPREAARTMARQLAATAQPGLVAALGPGVLALAAPRLGVPHASPVLAIPTTDPDALHLQLLTDLGPRPDTTALEHALRVRDVLSTERVGARFFTAFRHLVEEAGGSGPVRDAADRRLRALLPLTRILFLYFVQAKGWLDGRPDFLRSRLDDALARRRHFHRSVLHPLFFGTLNRPPAARSRRARFGAVPYLNGGLFEPHPVEHALGPLVLSNAFWREAFDGVFERFRFCAREGDEVDAIAPDMLGRVFEGVMETRERRRSGTFYTPEPLVRDLVTATIATAVADDLLSRDAARAALRGETTDCAARRALLERLARIRVLDPAVGSGAFLLGALEVLTAAWTGGRSTAARRSRIRRRILETHLFGVDINPIAVRLAELRLWLAIVADDPERDVARVRPLPNLNGIVRQGDTLLDPLAAARALGLARVSRAAVTAVTAARAAVFAARGSARAPALASLRRAELAAAGDMVAEATERTTRALRELQTAARSSDLFGRRAGLGRDQRRQCALLRERLTELRAAARAVGHERLPFFSFEVHHPQAMAAGGFSVVVGNPPWVRAERLPRGMRGTLAGRFRWWRGGGARGFRHQPDLSVAFLERAFELAADGAAVGFLLPAKLASAGYAETARARLVRDTTITYLHRLPERDAAGFGASVYPLAFVGRKAAPPDAHRVQLALGGGGGVRQDALRTPGPWLLIGDAQRQAIGALRRSGMLLADVAPPVVGVKTGADAVLLGTVLARDGDLCRIRLGKQDIELEASVLRPAVRGRDLAPYRATLERVLVWPYTDSGVPWRALPPRAARWIATQRTRLARRADYRDGPLWTLFRVRAAVGPHRVAWADVARTGTAVALDDAALDAIPLNTCYVSHAPDRESALAIAATLNSLWIRVLIHTFADEARGGYRRYNARVTGTVPIPRPGAARRRLAALSLAAHTSHDIDTDAIDAAVAEALELPSAVRDALRDLARDQG